MTEQVKYHKTGQFRNAIQHLKRTITFTGVDAEGNATYDQTKVKEPIEYTGTVKLHGTHATIVSKPWSRTYHSKEKLLGKLNFVDEGFDVVGDNAGFLSEMMIRNTAVEDLEDIIVEHYELYGMEFKICGEWAGPSIQKGVGISEIEKKSWFIFGIKCEDTWLDLSDLDLTPVNYYGIYNIEQFPTFSLEVDLNFPEKAAVRMTELVEQVEKECPVAKELGVTDNLLGEGLVWIPVSEEYRSDTGTWFKTKGEKHSTTKVKKLVSVSPEKLESIEKFVEYAVTENRLQQGLQEVGCDVKLTGNFIGWVNKDINTEESDVLLENNLSMKDVGKQTANIARNWYLEQCSKV